jgi:16S rRNA (uracil1498-N3)-methyltransferase
LIRLYVAQDLHENAQIAVAAQHVHYLAHVMRVRAGDELLAFNGRDGEWRMRVLDISRRAASLLALGLERPQTIGPDLDLLIALVKRARLDTIVEKAAELGARRVGPLITERASADHTNLDRLRAIAMEAAEQTGRLDVPDISPPARLAEVLAGWSADRRLMFCDEAGGAEPILVALASAQAGPWTILIGPEGGFSPDERAAVRAVPGAVPVSLGPRVLRADTAAISALSLWQASLGDWRGS